MGDDVRAAGEALLGQAAAVAAAFPDRGAMGRVPVGDVPPADGDSAAVRAAAGALRRLRAELLLVRAGAVGTLGALVDDGAAALAALAALSRHGPAIHPRAIA